MRSLDELLTESSAIHGHHCAGQVLGVRMAMLGCREVGIDEPRGTCDSSLHPLIASSLHPPAKRGPSARRPRPAVP